MLISPPFPQNMTKDERKQIGQIVSFVWWFCFVLFINHQSLIHKSTYLITTFGICTV